MAEQGRVVMLLDLDGVLLDNDRYYAEALPLGVVAIVGQQHAIQAPEPHDAASLLPRCHAATTPGPGGRRPAAVSAPRAGVRGV